MLKQLYTSLMSLSYKVNCSYNFRNDNYLLCFMLNEAIVYFCLVLCFLHFKCSFVGYMN